MTRETEVANAAQALFDALKATPENELLALQQAMTRERPAHALCARLIDLRRLLTVDRPFFRPEVH